MMRNRFFMICAAALSVAACSAQPEPDPAIKTSSQSATAAATYRGYNHAPSTSKLRLGASVYSDRLFEFERVVGTEGVIAIGRHGVTIGVPNADAPSTRVAPFSGSAAEHDARVLRYFKDGGLPAEQVGPTHVTTLMEDEGAAAVRPPATQPKPHLVGYNTVIDRQLDGIRVSGSYAWARFNANDDVVAEEVFWPELPSTLVAAANAMKATLTDATSRADFMGRLPEEFRGLTGDVVIHHSPHFQTTFETFVAVAFSGQHTGERRFRLDGTEVRFQYEQASPGPSTTKK